MCVCVWGGGGGGRRGHWRGDEQKRARKTDVGDAGQCNELLDQYSCPVSVCGGGGGGGGGEGVGGEIGGEKNKRELEKQTSVVLVSVTNYWISIHVR